MDWEILEKNFANVFIFVMKSQKVNPFEIFSQNFPPIWKNFYFSCEAEKYFAWYWQGEYILRSMK